MRLALLLNRDVESCLALNLLLPSLRDRIAAVFLSERVGGSPAGRARALGQLGFVEQTLFTRFVFPLAERQRDPAERFVTFAEVERQLGIPVRSIASARTAEGLTALREARADLFLSIRFGHILGAEAIAIPRRGVLNLHSGLLPAYRGVLATFRALQAGDDEIGCTLHWIDSPAIDRGRIIATARHRVDPGRSLLWHIVSLYPLGAELIRETVDRIAQSEPVAAEEQDLSAGNYYSYPTDEELVRFTAAGWRLFDPEDIQELAARFGLG